MADLTIEDYTRKLDKARKALSDPKASDELKNKAVEAIPIYEEEIRRLSAETAATGKPAVDTIPDKPSRSIFDTAREAGQNLLAEPLRQVVKTYDDPGRIPRGLVDMLSGAGQLGAGAILNIPGIENLAAGGKLTPEGEAMKAMPGKVVEHYAGYLDPETAKQRIAEDPYGTMFDFAPATQGLGALAKVGKLPKTAKALDYLDPLTISRKGIEAFSNRRARLSQEKEAAREAGISPDALRSISESMGEIPEARDLASKIGPDARTFMLADKLYGDVKGIASQSTLGPTSRQGLMDTVKDILDRSGPRAVEKTASILGPGTSKFDVNEAKIAAEHSLQPMYELGKTKPLDPTVHQSIIDDINARIAKEPDGSSLTPKLHKLKDMLTVGGKAAPTMDYVMRFKQRAKQYVKGAASKENLEAGVDPYTAGAREGNVGVPMNDIVKQATEILHSDGTLKRADLEHSQQEALISHYDIGRDRIIGTGKKMIEPEELSAIVHGKPDPRGGGDIPPISPENLQMLKEGTSRAAIDYTKERSANLTGAGSSALGNINRALTNERIAQIYDTPMDRRSKQFEEAQKIEEEIVNKAKGIKTASQSGASTKGKEEWEPPNSKRTVDIDKGIFAGGLAATLSGLSWGTVPAIFGAGKILLRKINEEPKYNKLVDDVIKGSLAKGLTLTQTLDAIEKLRRKIDPADFNVLQKGILGVIQANRMSNLEEEQ